MEKILLFAGVASAAHLGIASEKTVVLALNTHLLTLEQAFFGILATGI